jgi:hypothetical protein
MRQCTEQDLLASLSNVKNKKPLRLASQEWEVLLSTLRNRNYGGEKHALASDSQQRL